MSTRQSHEPIHSALRATVKKKKISYTYVLGRDALSRSVAKLALGEPASVNSMYKNTGGAGASEHEATLTESTLYSHEPVRGANLPCQRVLRVTKKQAPERFIMCSVSNEKDRQTERQPNILESEIS